MVDFKFDGVGGPILGFGFFAFIAKLFISSSFRKVEKMAKEIEETAKSVVIINCGMDSIIEKLKTIEKLFEHNAEILHRHDKDIAILKSYNHQSVSINGMN